MKFKVSVFEVHLIYMVQSTEGQSFQIKYLLMLYQQFASPGIWFGVQ